MVWCGVVWCGVCGVCGVVWCGVVWCSVEWCGVVWCGVVWCMCVVLLAWCGVPCKIFIAFLCCMGDFHLSILVPLWFLSFQWCPIHAGLAKIRVRAMAKKQQQQGREPDQEEKEDEERDEEKDEEVSGGEEIFVDEKQQGEVCGAMVVLIINKGLCCLTTASTCSLY